MMPPLVATKLFVPTAPGGALTRDRLLDRLDDGATKKLTVISAPAGFGKTTLLASWLAVRTAPRAVAWLSLDAQDSNTTLFWTGVMTALRVATSDPATAPGDWTVPVRSSIEVTVPAVLNYLAGTPGEVLLVLDDYHLVDRPEIAAGMKVLVEYLPPNAHVVLCTRADPDLLIARWRARGELVELRASDLRFTSQESAAYLTTAATVPLTDAQIATLASRTEGWIAALQLAVISLRQRVDAAAFIDGFAGDHRFVVDFLVEEVLNGQPPEVRDFLLRTAVLDRLSAPLCDALVVGDHSARMLVTLERANLFLVALDDRREWFRYHQLFADVLRARLRSEAPDLVPRLHERASRWFEEQDLTNPTIRHALAAGNIPRAVGLIELAIPEVRRNRQEGLASTWLEGLPAYAITASPALGVLAAGLAMLSGDLPSVRTRLDDAERALCTVGEGEAGDLARYATVRATIAIYRASLAQADGETQETVRHARSALAVADSDDHLSRGAAAGFLGLAAWADGDIQQASDTFGQAVASLHAAGNLIDALSATVILADLCRAAGRPRQARELCEAALRQAVAHQHTAGRAIAELHVALAELDIEAGDLDAAQGRLAEATTWNRRIALSENVSRHHVAKALLAQARGDLVAATAYLDEAEGRYRPGFIPNLRPIASLRARFRISEGDLGAAYAWARQREVTTADEADHGREFDHLTLVRLLMAEHRTRPGGPALGQALSLLSRVRAAATSARRMATLMEIDILAALALDAQGQRREALTTLASTWRLTKDPQAYVRLFLNEGLPMTHLLGILARDPGVGHHARRLLSAAHGVEDPASTTRGGPGAAGLLSPREVEVLRLLDSELSGPDIARALFISPNTLHSHTKHIFSKLDVRSRRAAVLQARDRGLLPPAAP